MLPYGPVDFTVQDVWLQVSDHIIVVIWLIKTFFLQLFCVLLPPLPNLFYVCRSIPSLSFIVQIIPKLTTIIIYYAYGFWGLGI